MKIRPCRQWAALDARVRDASARDDWNYFHGLWAVIDVDQLPTVVEALGEHTGRLEVRALPR